MKSFIRNMKSCPINMTNRMFIISVVWLIAFVDYNECAALKRSAAPDLNSDDTENNLDKMNPNYDEYPLVVPKRAAMLLDRIMVALHHALEDNDTEGVQRITDLYKSSRHTANKGRFEHLRGTENDINYIEMPFLLNTESGPNDFPARFSTDESMMGMQRRGHGEGLANKNRAYWRCYFNAVTCF